MGVIIDDCKCHDIKRSNKKIFNKEELFILDVRNEEDFQDWKIEGENFDYLNIPYFELLDGVEEIIEKIPNDKEVLVVCAKEGSSVMVGEMISDAGFNVSYLQGGMKAWSEHLEPLKVGDLNDGGELYQFVRIGNGCLSYMVVSNGEAVLIDATRMTDIYLEFAESINAKITMYLIRTFMPIIFPGDVQLLRKLGQPIGCHQKMQRK